MTNANSKKAKKKEDIDSLYIMMQLNVPKTFIHIQLDLPLF